MKFWQNYREYARLSIKTRVGYRVDFTIGTVGVIASNALNLALFGVLTSFFPSIGGWNFWELVFLYNLWLLAHGFYSTFFKNIENLQTLIVSGDFDKFLLKPVNPLVQLMGSQFYFFGAGDWAVAVTMLLVAGSHLGLAWTAGIWLFFGLTIIASALLETAIALILSTLAFWFSRADALAGFVFQFNYGLTQKYPIDLFPLSLQGLLTFVFPFAFMNFFPAQILLGRPDKALFFPELAWFGPLVALIFCAAALAFWRVGLNHYKSSGS